MRRRVWLLLSLVLLSLGGSMLFVPPCVAVEGEWVFVDYDYHSYFESLPSYGMWRFNTTVNSGERWVVNVSLSCMGFRHVTVLICDDTAYEEWLSNGDTSGCLFVENTSRPLDAVVTFPHDGSWHLVLNNTGMLSQLVGVIVGRYRWSAVVQSPDIGDMLGEGLVWLVSLLVIACVLVPCVCRSVCRNN